MRAATRVVMLCDMRPRARASSPRPTPTGRAGTRLFAILGAVMTAGALGSALVLLQARAAGVTYWGTSPVVALCVAATVLVGAGAALWTARHGDRVVACWILGTAASLFAYVGGMAVMTALLLREAEGGRAGGWVALEGVGGFILPFVVLQVALLAARDRVAGWPARRRGWVVALFTVAGVNLLLFAGAMEPEPPLENIRPPLGGTWVETLAQPAVSTALYIAWLLSVAVGPVTLWRAVGKTSGWARRRMTLVAIVALLPALTVVSCAVLLPVLMVAGLGEAAAVNVLFLFFLLAFALTTVGLATVVSDREGRWSGNRGLRVVLQVVVGLFLGQVVVTVSALAAVRLADGAVAVVVLVTASTAALLWPLNSRLVRRLTYRADPRLRVAARLSRDGGGELSRQPARLARQVLRAALDDPDLDIGGRAPDSDRWASVEGDDLPPVESLPPEHVTSLPDEDGRPRLYIRHRATTAEVRPVVAEVAPLLDKAALELAVRHQTEQLVRERARADRAATEERRRLERDLHDGVQGRLLALAIDLQAEMPSADGATQLVLDEAVSSLRTAITEIRRLGAGAAPELLSRDGLRPALQELVSRMPVPATLTVAEGRLAPSTEVVAYLVVSEALTNVVRHAGADTVDVVLDVTDGTLGIRVTDDGSGGADLRAGTGLRGLSERVSAAGGTLIVSDRPTGGTLLEVALPCGP